VDAARRRARGGATTTVPRTLALEVEILVEPGRDPGNEAPLKTLRRAVEATLGAAGVADGHVALTVVSPGEIRRLNRLHRGRDAETDVLSFPIDPGPGTAGPRELGDVVVCPQRADDAARAAVHGVLHLLGEDHDRDDGEMLALEDRIMAGLR
jgi:probable rRNA maturation factor